MAKRSTSFLKNPTSSILSYSNKHRDYLAQIFHTDYHQGLNQLEATSRLKEYGYNSLTSHEINALKIFLRQFQSAFIYLLLLAAALTFFLGEISDALIIIICLAVNVGLGFYQEYSSEKTARFLKKYTSNLARVLRDGQITTMVADNLVPGDIIILKTGDKVPADVRIIGQNNLMVDESILTGESLAVYKSERTNKKMASNYQEATNLCFAGTNIVGGQAKALVLATGARTEFGRIAQLTTETKKVSNFQKGIAQFSHFILKLIGYTLLIVFIVSLAVKRGQINILDLMVFLIALTVSVIPEALPLVTTISLSHGARQLAKKKVIVKRLSAVEDLGGIEILCSDKTGTLTENNLTIHEIYSKKPDATLLAAAQASAFNEQMSEPFDIAIWQKISDAEQAFIKQTIKLTEEPFNPTIGRNIVLVEDPEGHHLITRGAPEQIIACSQNLTNKKRQKIIDWVAKEGREGRRTLAIASQPLSGFTIKEIKNLALVNNFNFLGVISFVDPIKTSTKAAVKKAKSLGVSIKIITGDSLEVAIAVAKEIGLIKRSNQAMTGTAWQQLSPAQKVKALNNKVVFARVNPEQKYEIVNTLRHHCNVGFLGEGINDAPALKIAGVSLVVNSAADIAREAADIILVNKNLNVILDGIEYGRRVFANTTKYIKATLASNFGNFFAVATASLLVPFLPMLPVQILLLNLLSDMPMVMIASDTVAPDELLSPQKYEVNEITRLTIVLGIISTIFDFILFAFFRSKGPAVLQTSWFIGSVLTELGLFFSIRTKSLFFKTVKPPRSILLLNLLILVITLGLPFTFLGQNFFHFVPPTPTNLLLIITIVLLYFVSSEAGKLLYYHKYKTNYHLSG